MKYRKAQLTKGVCLEEAGVIRDEMPIMTKTNVIDQDEDGKFVSDSGIDDADKSHEKFKNVEGTISKSYASSKIDY